MEIDESDFNDYVTDKITPPGFRCVTFMHTVNGNMSTVFQRKLYGPDIKHSDIIKEAEEICPPFSGRWYTIR